MSKLLETIKEHQLEARKERDTVRAKLLTTLIGEASPSGNGVIDNKAVQATIKKFLKNLRITAKHANTPDLQREIVMLEYYLPPVLKGEALKIVIVNTIKDVNATSMRDMGNVMGKLIQRDATIDMSEAQSLIKKVFC